VWRDNSIPGRFRFMLVLQYLLLAAIVFYLHYNRLLNLVPLAHEYAYYSLFFWSGLALMSLTDYKRYHRGEENQRNFWSILVPVAIALLCINFIATKIPADLILLVFFAFPRYSVIVAAGAAVYFLLNKLRLLLTAFSKLYILLVPVPAIVLYIVAVTPISWAVPLPLSGSDADQRVLWQYNSKSNVNVAITIGGAVVYINNAGERLEAITADTGEVLWSYLPEGGLAQKDRYAGRTSPQVNGGRVYFTTADGRICAVSADSGEKAWEYQTAYSYFNFFASIGKLIVFSQFDTCVLCALDAETGAKQWELKADLAGTPQDHPYFVLLKDKIVFKSEIWQDEGPAYAVYIINGANGTISRTFACTAFDTFFINPGYDLLYLVRYEEEDARTIEVLDINTGESKWQYNVAYCGSFSAAGEFVCFYQMPEHQLLVLAAETGDVKWVIPSPEEVDPGTCLTEDAVYLFYNQGKSEGQGWANVLTAFNLANGEEKWSRGEDDMLNYPTVVDGAIYYSCWRYNGGNSSTRLYRIDADTGEAVWGYRVAGSIEPPTIATEHAVYFSTGNGFVYALSAQQ